MNTISIGERGASALLDPDELDDLVAKLLERHAIVSPAIKRSGVLARTCRCDHPIDLAEDWGGPRCLLCGRDVHER